MSIRTKARIMIAGGGVLASTLVGVANPSSASADPVVNCTHKVTRNDNNGAAVFPTTDIRSTPIKRKAKGSNVTSPARCGWYKRGSDGWRYVPVWLAEGGYAWMLWNDLNNNNTPIGQ
jgi:hypothetical protein